jgi:MFS family permease
VIGIGVALLVVGFMESAVFAMVDAFDQPPSFVGVIISVQGVGAVAGGLSSSWLIKRFGEVTAIWGSLILFAVALGVCAASPLLSVVFIGVVFLGYGLPVFIVAFMTLLQRRTPGRLMGRVSTATEVVLGTPQAISIAMGALLVSVISYRSIYWICATVIIAAAIYLRVAVGSAGPTVPDVSAAGGGGEAELGEDLAEVEPGRLD